MNHAWIQKFIKEPRNNVHLFAEICAVLRASFAEQAVDGAGETGSTVRFGSTCWLAMFLASRLRFCITEPACVLLTLLVAQEVPLSGNTKNYFL